jgi:translation initiation factor 1
MTDLGDPINLATKDPFADTLDDDDDLGKAASGNVHIRITQRNGRKSITTIQGLPTELDLKKILKDFKKQFNCNGSISEDPDLGGTVVQLQGDQRDNVRGFLLKESLVDKDKLKVHGF